MLTFEQIKELIELVADRGLEGVEIDRSGFRVKIDGRRAVVAAAPVAAPAPAIAGSAPVAPVTATQPVETPAEAAPSSSVPEGAHVVTCPIVGTFYASPNPESPPYARIGDRVAKGDVLCIVEAMKLMNEIESDASGVLVDIFPKNAQPVEFGEPLFAIQPD